MSDVPYFISISYRFASSPRFEQISFPFHQLEQVSQPLYSASPAYRAVPPIDWYSSFDTLVAIRAPAHYSSHPGAYLSPSSSNARSSPTLYSLNEFSYRLLPAFELRQDLAQGLLSASKGRVKTAHYSVCQGSRRSTYYRVCALSGRLRKQLTRAV